LDAISTSSCREPQSKRAGPAPTSSSSHDARRALSRDACGLSASASSRGRRLWASLALVAAAAATAALIGLLLSNVVAFAIVLAAVAAAAAAGWFALTRHGIRRVVGGVAVVAAVVAGIVAFFERAGTDELVVFALSAAAFAFLSRKALAPPAHPTSPAGSRPRRLPQGATRGTLLLNPKSGGGKVERFDLDAEARARDIETIMLRPGDDLRELAIAAAARGPRALGVAGGDGSQALIAQICVERDLPFVCVPAGTRNHLALDLGLDVKDVVAALDAFVDGVEARIDLAYVNDRVFVNNTSVGVYADIVQSRDYRDAKLMTSLEAVPNLLGPDAARRALSFEGPDGTVRESSELLLVSNNPYELRKPLAVGTRPALDTGRLGIAELEISGALAAAGFVTLELLGRASARAGFEQWTAETFDVWADAPIVAAIDGEAVTLTGRLHFRIAPSALRIVLPADAELRRLADRRPSRAKVGALGRLALGGDGTPAPRR
jgi:diacylglycerol kinase family enzyme